MAARHFQRILPTATSFPDFPGVHKQAFSFACCKVDISFRRFLYFLSSTCARKKKCRTLTNDEKSSEKSIEKSFKGSKMLTRTHVTRLILLCLIWSGAKILKCFRSPRKKRFKNCVWMPTSALIQLRTDRPKFGVQMQIW